jgi:hypothetical protein
MTAFERFKQSMVIDYVKWHDGEGYDMDAIRAATPEERAAIEALIVERGVHDWRDVEALAALKSSALESAAASPDDAVRMAVSRHAPEVMTEEQRTQSLVSALTYSRIGSGLGEAIDQAAEFHPPAVVHALMRGALHRAGEAAVLFAGLLTYIAGKADEPFDWAQRPLFLRFNDEGAERKAAFLDLCHHIGADPAESL